MEEIYREESRVAGDRKVIAALAFIVVMGLFAYEIYKSIQHHTFDPLGIGMSCCLIGLWMWRVCYAYTLILYKDHRMEVITHGFLVNRSYVVDLTRTESFTNKYVRSFFRKTKISHYIHRYSSLDGADQRLLVFTEGKKNKLAGIIFKSSDEFVRVLRRQMPDKYIQL